MHTFVNDLERPVGTFGTYRAVLYRPEERLLSEVIEILEQTDAYFDRAETDMELAEVLRLAGRPVEAAPLIEEAVRLSELREDVVTTTKARQRLAALTH